MEKKWWDLWPPIEARGHRLLVFIRKLFEPAVFIGDRNRVRKPDEPDEDEKRLGELNRTWRQMLREDPWMQKLMTHVRLLTQATLVFFAVFLICGLTLHAKHPAFSYIIAGFFATVPYWLWIGKWNHRIELKVFEAFKKKFGKYFHLE